MKNFKIEYRRTYLEISKILGQCLVIDLPTLTFQTEMFLEMPGKIINFDFKTSAYLLYLN